MANSRGRTGLAVLLLCAFGLLIGVSVAGTISYYAATDPTAVRQAFAATTLSVAGLGSVGYAVRRDLSFLYRLAFWLLVALLARGCCCCSSISRRRTWAGRCSGWWCSGSTRWWTSTGYDARRADEAIPLAAGIFLDVLNIFLLFLRLFQRG